MSSRQGSDYRCAYCGGYLDRRYYFCIHCATAWCEPDPAIYEEGPPPVPTLEGQLRREGRPAWEFFLLLAIALIALGSLTHLGGKGWIGPAIILQDLVVASATISFAIYHWREISHLFRRIRLDWALLASIPLLAVLLWANQAYHEFIVSLFDIKDADRLENLLLGSMPFPLLLISICVFPAIFEEIGFRGVIQERLVRVAGFTLGILITSILFVALHFNILSAPYLLLLSIFLCWVRARTASIYPSIIIHFLHNLAVLFLWKGGGS